MASQPDGEFRLPSGRRDVFCSLRAECQSACSPSSQIRCAAARTPAVHSLAALIQSRPVSRLKPDCVSNISALFFFFSSFLFQQNHESRAVFSLCGEHRRWGRRTLALTSSRCPLRRPAAGMQGVFCLARSSEVIQGGRFTLRWETKTERKETFQNANKNAI